MFCTLHLHISAAYAMREAERHVGTRHTLSPRQRRGIQRQSSRILDLGPVRIHGPVCRVLCLTAKQAAFLGYRDAACRGGAHVAKWAQQTC